MESHVKWGLGFVVTGIVLEITLPFLFILDTVLILLGIALILFGGRDKKVEEVKE
ncbi:MULTISPECIES: hypothetical protein [unclassified Archaeoglobus]|jgi:hypothetical protein|uniref:hypothetical protein n=1 Tax=unclassified Archaeoglobus TaxID=2643606 RepID=UPI0025C44D0F|nr:MULTISPECIES: hypothetical protein [unclassified Archaeoglobus]